MKNYKNNTHIKGRRNFIKITAASGLAFTLPGTVLGALKTLKNPIKIGLIADLHHDIMHDGIQRMQAFVDEVSKQKPNAIFQLGDFAYPSEKNKKVIDLFNHAHKTALHVIGNHDTDSGHTTEQCINYWGMPARYYAMNIEGITFLVLDGNEKGSPTHEGGYPAYIGKEQQDWLKNQLQVINGPIVIVSHQPLLGPLAIDNAEMLQDILASASNKILFAINGHTHIDALLKTKGVTYVHLNSASYLWVGADYKHQSYAADIHEKYPWISHTCPYQDSLFSFMTIDPDTGTVIIKGSKSEWMGTPPNELGVTKFPTLTFGEEIAPRIRDRQILKLKN